MTRSTTLRLAAAIAALPLAASFADAAIVTFDSPNSGPVFQEYAGSVPYKDNGLTFASNYSRYVWLPGAGQGAANGTQVLENGYSELTISASSGVDFTFSGLDYGQGIYHDISAPLTITLNLAGGGTSVFNLISTESFQAFAPGSTLVSSVTLSNTGGYLAIDNVDVGGVPEASTWAMLILGFGATGGALRSRRHRRIAAQ
jgi:hypothetical protein